MPGSDSYCCVVFIAKHSAIVRRENNYITGRTRAKKSENGRICLQRGDAAGGEVKKISFAVEETGKVRGTFVADNHVAVDVEQKPVAGQTRTCISRVSMNIIGRTHIDVTCLISNYTFPMCTCDSAFIGTDTRHLEQYIS